LHSCHFFPFTAAEKVVFRPEVTLYLFHPFIFEVTSAVENPYQRLARATSGYRTSACNCWVTLRVTQKVHRDKTLIAVEFTVAVRVLSRAFLTFYVV
jgi:hypothetical protein